MYHKLYLRDWLLINTFNEKWIEKEKEDLKKKTAW